MAFSLCHVSSFCLPKPDHKFLERGDPETDHTLHRQTDSSKDKNNHKRTVVALSN